MSKETSSASHHEEYKIAVSSGLPLDHHVNLISQPRNALFPPQQRSIPITATQDAHHSYMYNHLTHAGLYGSCSRRKQTDLRADTGTALRSPAQELRRPLRESFAGGNLLEPQLTLTLGTSKTGKRVAYLDYTKIKTKGEVADWNIRTRGVIGDPCGASMSPDGEHIISYFCETNGVCQTSRAVIEGSLTTGICRHPRCV